MMKKNKKNYNQVSITNNIRWLKTKMAVHKIWRRLWWRWWGIRSNNDDNVDYDDDHCDSLHNSSWFVIIWFTTFDFF